MGRFLSPDVGADIVPLPYATLENPQSLNLYSYVHNNPLSKTDFDGHDVHVCADNGNGGQSCSDFTDDQWKQIQQGNNPGISFNLNNFGSGTISCGGSTCGTSQYFEKGLQDDTGTFLNIASMFDGLRAIPAAAQGIMRFMAQDAGEAAASVASDAATVVGRKRFPIDIAPGTNEGTTIGGRFYSGHALDQMQGRGLVPSVVEDTISTGVKSPGNTAGTSVFTNGQAKVVLNSRGDVITAIPQSK